MLKAISVPALMLAAAAPMAMEAPEAISWEVLADCAAAYEGNVFSRRNDPDRGPEMSNMIQEIAAEYEAAAIEAHGEDFTSMYTAQELVRQHIDANVERFVEMDGRGDLDAYVEKCPQPY